MYTRSYSDRNARTTLPPDYSGTALTLRPPTDETPSRVALTQASARGTAFGRDVTPRYPQYDKESYYEPSDGIDSKTEAPIQVPLIA